ncbi:MULTISPECIES: ATP-binding protein [unclassified Streptomyces]|uniref:ATP-binding protein n=1 Tax=unclassified Streptomyces TaxID=2593676 RepID=UPI001369A12C|nr:MULTISPECIES: ATP-binding protein [unclassified Streptomyces]NDZ98749.1 ATP-binding protein [Streptomyces sp. SID10116]MYY83389.1 ATP-binding protein [Streptomyces sp. SID335]MYZ15727.1 ATP-binding protein [Streptomyces sp. SID337]NDZ84773.1 ATP-binding protein [Streptomyces sp. SID10115]NEB43034.1 ATP-binding protein [Streptomyces sp. SID339]
MSEDDKNPAREIITDYAQSHFRYFRTADGTVYAQKNGHPVARPIRSQGTTGSHRQELMVGLFKDGLGVFNGTALKEALDLIEALALSEDVQAVHIRVAPGYDGATWLDLGRSDGQSVRIHATGWDVAVPDPREVCWRRTQLTGELPLPAKDTNGKGIDLLMRLCNFATAETECLAIAWLIGCLGPSVPVPAPFLTGPQGAGKSTAGRMLLRIVEGMSGDLRRAPKDEENLLAAVAAGWVTALDNLSYMTPDLSDAMCCIVTGAENVKRALFTDGDVFRVGYRRPLLMTGIDVGVIRPDLAERLLPLRLVRPRVRRTEAELWAEYAEVLPVVLGSLLDLTVKVRAAEAETPTDLRMADFAHLCAQLDAATGLGVLPAYRAALDDLNDDVIEGDLLAQTVLKHADGIEPGTALRMTSTEWLHCLSGLYSGEDFRPLPKGWPTTGKVLSDRLKRLQPTLAARGVLVDSGRTREGRYLEMTRSPGTAASEQQAF